MITIISAIAGGLIYLAFHFGAGHAYYRHAKAAPQPQGRHHGPQPRVSIWASLARGPYIGAWGSIPLPGGFRLGHKLFGIKL